MTFSGLGLNTMVHHIQKDISHMQLGAMATNIQIYNNALTQAATYLDITDRHKGYKAQLDVETDTNQTFIFEYQALLRSRIQQMVSELTAALTNDLDFSLSAQAAGWNNRPAMMGFTNNGMIDAGAARSSYVFFTGFANAGTVSPAGSAAFSDLMPTTAPYTGIASPDGTARVPEDTQADAIFGQVRSMGTASVQQAVPDTGVTTAVLDNLNIGVSSFIVPRNRYRLSLNYANTGILGNINDDTLTPAPTNNIKNNFEKILHETLADFEAKNMLRDVLRMSDSAGFLNNVQIASTTSIPSGSQVQASLFLNYVPTDADRPDLGGSVRLEFDRWTAFYHS